MKKLIPFALSAMLLVPNLSFAEKIPENGMPLSQVLETLKTKGFMIIKEIDFNDGFYEAKVINSLGKDFKMSYNPKTGEMKSSGEQTFLPASEIAKKLEASGYTNIYKMKVDSDKEYEVHAIDKDGKKMILQVNAQNAGIISQKED